MRGTVTGVVVLLAGCGRIGFGSGTGTGPVPEGRWRQVAVSAAPFLHGNTTCAVTTTGELWCWGYGFDGQLGIGSTPGFATPTRVGTETDWTAVTVGVRFACGLRGDGSRWCWGANGSGQLGAMIPGALVPTSVDNQRWSRLQAGDDFGCGIRTDATLWCWGGNGYGQLGNGTTTTGIVPAQVGTARWLEVAASSLLACGVQTDGTLWCWGYDSYGQFGDGTRYTMRTTPGRVGTRTSWRTIAVGPTHSCALEQDGTAWCWGVNVDGDLGTGAARDEAAPAAVVGAPRLATIAVGSGHSCGTTEAGELWCWGSTGRGQFAGTTSAAPVLQDQAAVAVAAGGWLTCVIDAAAHLSCTGANARGQAGQPPGETRALVQADQRDDWTAIYAQTTHACGTTADGGLWCWGEGASGQLGDGTWTDRQQPVRAGSQLSDVDIGDRTTLAISSDQHGWTWGYSMVASDWFGVPTDDLGGTASVALGASHLCRIDPAGALACTGYNYNGQIGSGAQPSNQRTPGFVAVGGGATWTRVLAQGDATCAVQVDPAPGLYCWGFGEMTGTSSSGQVLSPTLVPMPAGTIASTTFGADAACTLVDGQLWCWGRNGSGQLGDGTRVTRLGATLTGARADWIDLDLGDFHGCAVAADRSLWCWGHGDDGQTGNASFADVSRPAQVGADHDWIDVACGAHFTCAIKANGTRWCVGNNDEGELGDGRSWIAEFTIVP